MTAVHDIELSKTTRSVNRLTRDRHNARQSIRENGIEELVMSIKAHGTLQPLVITPSVWSSRAIAASKRPVAHGDRGVIVGRCFHWFAAARW